MRGTITFLIARIFAAAFAVSLSGMVTVTNAQQLRPERTIEEIKVEAITRAENGQYPCIGHPPDDLREAFASIKTRDRGEWAAAFIAVGDKWMAEASLARPSDVPRSNNSVDCQRPRHGPTIEIGNNDDVRREAQPADLDFPGSRKHHYLPPVMAFVSDEIAEDVPNVEPKVAPHVSRRGGMFPSDRSRILAG